MPGRPVAVALFLLLNGHLAAQSDTAFVECARGRVVPIDSTGRLIGVGESVHEAQPFLTFRFELLKDLLLDLLKRGVKNGIGRGWFVGAGAKTDPQDGRPGTQPGNAAACFTQVAICASSSSSPSWMSK